MDPQLYITKVQIFEFDRKLLDVRPKIIVFSSSNNIHTVAAKNRGTTFPDMCDKLSERVVIPWC